MNNPTQSVPLQNIGRYEVRGELGHGAMGIVYKAIDPNIGRTVALKTMRMDVNAFDHDELLRRFKNEARAAGALNHPNIVTIYDADEGSGLFYIAMEYLEGRTLESILAENKMLPVERVIEITRQIVSGLDYAHGMSVIHRDIKPANILITRQGLVKIMDFGIAKAGATMATSASSVLGTPNYMSPEQVRGRPIDGRTDLFSLGVILYQMITGERPFSGENVTTVIYKIVNEEPIAPRDLDVSIHPGLSAVVTKCLAKEPNERFQNGAGLMRDLENYKTLTADENATTAFTLEEAARAASIPPANAGAAATTINRTAAQNAAGVNAGPQANSRFIGNPPMPPRSPAPVAKPQVHQPLTTVPLRMKDEPSKQKVQETVYRNKGLSGKIWTFLIVVAVIALGAVGFQFLPPAQRTQLSGTVDSWWSALTSKLHHSDSGTAVPTATPKAGITPSAAATPLTASSTDENSDTSKKGAKDALKGDVELRSDPIGVGVVTDGHDDSECVTPCGVKALKAGTHQFTFTLDGYATQTIKRDIKAGSNQLSVKMAASGATLLITSVPKDATINLDGKDTGLTTPHSFSVTPGSHTIVLTKPDFEAKTVPPVSVKAGDNSNVSYVLQLTSSAMQEKAKNWFGGNKPIPQGKGVLNIVTNPQGATVVVNGVTTHGKSPLQLIVPAVDYQIVVRLNGYRDEARTVHVDEGQQTKMSIDLQPK